MLVLFRLVLTFFGWFLFHFLSHDELLHELIKLLQVKWLTHNLHFTVPCDLVLSQQIGILITRGIVSPIVMLIESKASHFVEQALVPGVFLGLKVLVNLLNRKVQRLFGGNHTRFVCILSVIHIFLCQQVLAKKTDGASLSCLKSELVEKAGDPVRRDHFLEILLIHKTLLSNLEFLKGSHRGLAPDGVTSTAPFATAKDRKKACKNQIGDITKVEVLSRQDSLLKDFFWVRLRRCCFAVLVVRVVAVKNLSCLCRRMRINRLLVKFSEHGLVNCKLLVMANQKLYCFERREDHCREVSHEVGKVL